jgi:hypothetical protein
MFNDVNIFVTVHEFLNLELKYFCNCLREKSIFLRPESAAEKIITNIRYKNSLMGISKNSIFIKTA